MKTIFWQNLDNARKKVGKERKFIEEKELIGIRANVEALAEPKKGAQ
jgi:hypothetical protein